MIVYVVAVDHTTYEEDNGELYDYREFEVMGVFSSVTLAKTAVREHYEYRKAHFNHNLELVESFDDAWCCIRDVLGSNDEIRFIETAIQES